MGGSKFATPRKESDKAQILSGIFEGYTTGHPIAIIVFNENAHSKDYDNLKDLFRPAHADFTYFHKFGQVQRHALFHTAEFVRFFLV